MPRSPIRRHASSSGRRQSTLMTSEPQRAIDSRRCEVVVPKWIVGTPVSATASRMRRLYGSTIVS